MTKRQKLAIPIAGSPKQAARSHAEKLAGEIAFSSENLAAPAGTYVAWIDLMGAGHLMSTSIDKAANAIARIHLAVNRAVSRLGHAAKLVAINDGMFICSQSKLEICDIVRSTMMYLVAHFVSKNDPQNRFMARCAIAFGPVYYGDEILSQLASSRSKQCEMQRTLTQVVFGSPVIQAYKAEHEAPPFGVAVHESARTFSPQGVKPFRSTLWQWWQQNDGGGLGNGTPGQPAPLKSVLIDELTRYFDYVDAKLAFHGITEDHVKRWRSLSEQYFVEFSG